jgi:hypothetical protein
VIYGGLAFLMASGLIFFGIGSDASGGLSEIFGGGGGGDTGFENQIEDAEKALETNPQDTAALVELVQLHYQSGTQQIEIDENGQQVITADAEEDLQKGADAWDQLVKTSKDAAPSAAAVTAVQIFSTLAQGDLAQAATGTGQQALDDADDSLANWKAAAEAQQVAAGQKGDAESFANIAVLFYFGGDFAAGDDAAQQALAAAKGDESKQLQQELDNAQKQGQQVFDAIEQFRKQVQQASAGAPGGATGGDNPLSEIGGGGLSGGGGLGAP